MEHLEIIGSFGQSLQTGLVMTGTTLSINNVSLNMWTTDSALFYLAFYSDIIVVDSSSFDLGRAVLQINTETQLINCSFIGMYLIY